MTNPSSKRIYIIGDYNAHFSVSDYFNETNGRYKHDGHGGYGSLLYNWYNSFTNVDVLRTTPYFKTSVPSLFIPTLHPELLNLDRDVHNIEEPQPTQVDIINSTSIKNNIDSFLEDTVYDDILFFILHIGITDAKKSYPVDVDPSGNSKSSVYLAKNPYSFFIDGNTYVDPTVYESNIEYIVQQIINTHPNSKIFLITPQSNINLYSTTEYSNITKNIWEIYSSHLILIDSSKVITPDDFNFNTIIINTNGHYKIFKEIQDVIKSTHTDMKPLNLQSKKQHK
jgi:hypothetical protein